MRVIVYISQKYKNTWIGPKLVNGGDQACISKPLGTYKCICLREKFPCGGSVAENDHQGGMPIDDICTSYAYERCRVKCCCDPLGMGCGT